MNLEKAKQLVERQRKFFSSGKTRDTTFRIGQLRLLRKVVTDHEGRLLKALEADLGKPEIEAYFGEIYNVLDEIDYALKNIQSWVKPRKVKTPLILFPSAGCIYPEPYGVVLIIAPWNYPVSLLLQPLVGAVAAGNCAVLKPSNDTPHTAEVLTMMIRTNFDPAFIEVIKGGKEENQMLLKQKFDYIFFTGGSAVGRIVMESASKRLTPVTLELGGKSPCIVDSTADLDKTAKKIVWGKFYNAGQTCTAPDYVLVDRVVKEKLIQRLKRNIKEFYGDESRKSRDFARIVNRQHLDRLSNLMKHGRIVIGGTIISEERYIAPTIIDEVSWDDPIMQEEIFGPLLPILIYDDLGEAISLINSKPKPLALYIFSRSKESQKKILSRTSSGGVCVNDVVIHVAAVTLPFGGVGESGMGSYHGKATFDTFSHQKSILRKSLLLDLGFRYAPYNVSLAKIKKIIRFFQHW